MHNLASPTIQRLRLPNHSPFYFVSHWAESFHVPPFHMGQLGRISWCFMGDSGKVHHRRGRSKGVRRTLPFRKGPSCRPCLVMLMGKCCFASPSGKTSGDAITWLEPQVRSCFGQSPKKATGRGLSGISSACPRLFANHALGVLQVLIPQKAVALASPAEWASAALSFFLLAAQKDRSLRRTLCLNSHGDGDSSPPWSDLLSLLLVFVDGFQLEHSGGWHSTDIDVKSCPHRCTANEPSCKGLVWVKWDHIPSTHQKENPPFGGGPLKKGELPTRKVAWEHRHPGVNSVQTGQQMAKCSGQDGPASSGKLVDLQVGTNATT